MTEFKFNLFLGVPFPAMDSAKIKCYLIFVACRLDFRGKWAMPNFDNEVMVGVSEEVFWDVHVTTEAPDGATRLHHDG